MIITYTDDLAAFRIWLSNNKASHSEILDDNGVWLNIEQVPTRSNGNHSVSVVADKHLSFIQGTPLTVLAQGSDPWALIDSDDEAKVELALNRQTIAVYDFDDNFLYNWKEPLSFGVIAYAD